MIRANQKDAGTPRLFDSTGYFGNIVPLHLHPLQA